MKMGGLGSRRESEFGEQVSPEPTTDAPPQRRRRKKKTTPIADQTTDGEEVVKRTRKKKKPKVADSQLPDELDIEEDDIITDTPSSISQHALFSAPQERFQAAERSDWRKTSDQVDHMTDFQPTAAPWTTRDVSMNHLTSLSNLLEQYHGLAYPSQSLLYMLLAISTSGLGQRLLGSAGLPQTGPQYLDAMVIEAPKPEDKSEMTA
ncbi:hypothetical protein FQN60_006731 [Etheostoma spectabile]|uniref:Uncharacterized protein n=1 Tax=Etheostoma spectabile TaxID=54343 RepID=A0A5J5CDP7_9PERO|nr:hypothetical protein FQN60_006731 [Etheostoma spectabile]